MRKVFVMMLLIGLVVISFSSCEKAVTDSMTDVIDSSDDIGAARRPPLLSVLRC